MDGNWVQIIFISAAVIVVTVIQVKSIILKREQIKADALVRIEEVKCKNQRDLEMLMHREETPASAAYGGQSHELQQDDRRIREKI